VGYDLLGDGAGRLLNAGERDTRLMHSAELRRVLGELAVDGAVAKPALVGLVARFTARKRAA
jgi:hypothetical protein